MRDAHEFLEFRLVLFRSVSTHQGRIICGLPFPPVRLGFSRDTAHVGRGGGAKLDRLHLAGNSSSNQRSISNSSSIGLANPSSIACSSFDLNTARSSCSRNASRTTSLVEPYSPEATLLRA